MNAEVEKIAEEFLKRSELSYYMYRYFGLSTHGPEDIGKLYYSSVFDKKTESLDVDVLHKAAKNFHTTITNNVTTYLVRRELHGLLDRFVSEAILDIERNSAEISGDENVDATRLALNAVILLHLIPLVAADKLTRIYSQDKTKDKHLQAARHILKTEDMLDLKALKKRLVVVITDVEEDVMDNFYSLISSLAPKDALMPAKGKPVDEKIFAVPLEIDFELEPAELGVILTTGKDGIPGESAFDFDFELEPSEVATILTTGKNASRPDDPPYLSGKDPYDWNSEFEDDDTSFPVFSNAVATDRKTSEQPTTAVAGGNISSKSVGVESKLFASGKVETMANNSGHYHDNDGDDDNDDDDDEDDLELERSITRRFLGSAVSSPVTGYRVSAGASPIQKNERRERVVAPFDRLPAVVLDQEEIDFLP